MGSFYFFLMYTYINVQCLYFYGALQFVSEMVNKENFLCLFGQVLFGNVVVSGIWQLQLQKKWYNFI